MEGLLDKANENLKHPHTVSTIKMEKMLKKLILILQIYYFQGKLMLEQHHSSKEDLQLNEIIEKKEIKVEFLIFKRNKEYFMKLPNKVLE